MTTSPLFFIPNKHHLFIVAALMIFMSRCGATEGDFKEIAVIAPSISTAIESRSILSQMKWIETSPKNANVVLVVCRSSLYNPLMYSYDCYCKLKEDAEMQLNISGPKFHVYLFKISDDLSVFQVDHSSYDAD